MVKRSKIGLNQDARDDPVIGMDELLGKIVAAGDYAETRNLKSIGLKPHMILTRGFVQHDCIRNFSNSGYNL